MIVNLGRYDVGDAGNTYSVWEVWTGRLFILEMSVCVRTAVDAGGTLTIRLYKDTTELYAITVTDAQTVGDLVTVASRKEVAQAETLKVKVEAAGTANGAVDVYIRTQGGYRPA